MDVYNLYLDESLTFNRRFNKTLGKYENINKHFAIAGIIVEENFHENELTKKLSNLKRAIWYDNYPMEYNNFILHEKEIKEALEQRNKGKFNQISGEYKRFSIFKNAKKVFKYFVNNL